MTIIEAVELYNKTTNEINELEKLENRIKITIDDPIMFKPLNNSCEILKEDARIFLKLVHDRRVDLVMSLREEFHLDDKSEENKE